MKYLRNPFRIGMTLLLFTQGSARGAQPGLEVINAFGVVQFLMALDSKVVVAYVGRWVSVSLVD
jgi:hypothetical protein